MSHSSASPTPSGDASQEEVVIYDDLPDPSVYKAKGKRGTTAPPDHQDPTTPEDSNTSRVKAEGSGDNS
ncbi:hypothetical protein ACIRUL_34415 [Streptomyces sp. NPDC101171]|uniref:hypothetical protein n=1 Tax=Streptomyces sp. NPDC101171 TaxID=3366122 RepID=UPI0038133E2B